MVKSFKNISLFALIAIFCYGCKPQTNELRHPLFVKAVKLKEKGNFEESAKFFEEFLIKYPGSYKTNYELATLYGDHLGKTFYAIFHFKKYLKYAPKNVDYSNVEIWLKTTEEKYFKELQKQYDAEQISFDNENIELLKKQLKLEIQKTKKYLKNAKDLKYQNDIIRKALGKYMKQEKTSVVQKEVKKEAFSQVEDNQTNNLKSEFKDRFSSSQKIYIVQKNDSLSSISFKMYGSSKYYMKIYQANKDLLKTPADLQVGQSLKIPKIK